MSSLTQWKKYVLAQLGCGGEEDVKPPKSPQPHGKMRLFANYFKLAAVLALLGYFLYLLISLITQFAKDTADPPLRFSQKPGTNGEPFFPAIALCNTGYNRTIKLLEVGVALVGLGDDIMSCFPESGNDNCAGGFPVDRVNGWAFNIRNKEPSVRDPLEPPEFDTSIPQTDGSFDQNCIALNTSKLQGYQTINTERFRQRLVLLVSFQKPPANASLVRTPGLNGIEVYFFQDGTAMPGGIEQADQAFEQAPLSLGFKNLFSDPVLTNFQGFQALVDDEIILGAELMTYMSIQQSLTAVAGRPPRAGYNPNAIVSPLNRANFFDPRNPEVESNSTELALLTITYSSPFISVFENTPPSFAAFLGQIGGLKGIATDFLGAALIALAFLTSLHAARYPAPAGSNQVAVSDKA